MQPMTGCVEQTGEKCSSMGFRPPLLPGWESYLISQLTTITRRGKMEGVTA
jgi:hypothetical protein